MRTLFFTHCKPGRTESLKRNFAVYVVIAKSLQDTKLYVGKTGDNNDGCNPLISRCGNHFSYNKLHSQIRNHLEEHEDHDYIYVFDHFDNYEEDKAIKRASIDKINEMERWLNEAIQNAIEEIASVRLVNPYTGRGYLTKHEKAKRKEFRTPDNEQKIAGLVADVLTSLG